MDDQLKDTFKRELAALSTIRDELKVKANLARKDVQDELGRLEQKLRLAEEELQRTKSHAMSEAARIGNELKGLMGELKQGFENVKRRFEP